MNIERKGIILAGGTGSRLYPLTKVVSKQLMPIYNKPMIYYPLTTLMLGGIKEFLIITTPQDKNLFKNLLGTGDDFGISISYKVQDAPNGIAEAFIIADDYLDNHPSALILGDNIFHGNNLSDILQKNFKRIDESFIFASPVKDPERYGVIEFDTNNEIIKIHEKPEICPSNFAVTGLYAYDSNVVEKVKSLTPSHRGELEITDLNNLYIKESKLKVIELGRGTTWLDTGTPDSLLDANNFIHSIEKRHGQKIGCPEEVAWRMNFINDLNFKSLIEKQNNKYGEDLKSIIS